MRTVRLMALLLTMVLGMTASTAEVWLTRPQLAERLQISVKTLAQWATKGTGPRYARPGGGNARYRLSDVEAWEEAQFSGGDAA